MKEKLALYVVSHKDINLDNYPGRKIVYVGNNNFPTDNIKTFRDNTGDNISHKNSTFCELTVLYWIWKNVKDAEYVGIEHYRRCFYKGLFHIRSVESLYKKAQKVDFLHFQRVYHPFSEKWRMSVHEGKGLHKVLRASIERTYPEYLKQFDHQMKCWYCTYCNIFIAKKELFDKYMEFMFTILFDVEKHIDELDISERSRSIGYMAERLFDTFVNYNKYSHKTSFVNITRRYKK